MTIAAGFEVRDPTHAADPLAPPPMEHALRPRHLARGRCAPMATASRENPPRRSRPRSAHAAVAHSSPRHVPLRSRRRWSMRFRRATSPVAAPRPGVSREESPEPGAHPARLSALSEWRVIRTELPRNQDFGDRRTGGVINAGYHALRRQLSRRAVECSG